MVFGVVCCCLLCYVVVVVVERDGGLLLLFLKVNRPNTNCSTFLDIYFCFKPRNQQKMMWTHHVGDSI